MTRRSESPRARAETTYGLRSSSSRFARMMRMSCAVPASARITAGKGRCLTRSHTFAQLHGAWASSSEKRPPTFMLKNLKPAYMSTSASMKDGTARPMKPMNVAM